MHVTFIPGLATTLLLAEVIVVYKEPKELVVGAELDFCPHAYTTIASPRRELNPKRKSTEPSQQIKNVRTFRSRRTTPRRHAALRAIISLLCMYSQKVKCPNCL